MNPLRDEVMAQVLDALVHPPSVVQEDFDVKEDPSAESTRVKIQYALNDTWVFQFRVPSAKTIIDDNSSVILGFARREMRTREHKIEIQVTPGELTHTETGEVRSVGMLVSEIRSWVQRISELLRRGPVGRALDAHEARMNAFAERLEAIPNEKLTEAQIADVQARLDEIVQGLRVDIENLKQGDEDLRKQLSALAEEVASLRPRVAQMDKKQVIRALLGRFWRFATDPRTERFLKNTESVVRLLGSSSDN